MKISIITVSYNSENFIEGCINSLLNQSYKKKEVIYISREPIPSVAKFNGKIDYYKMVCVYTMTRSHLNKFQSFGISRNEGIESIDMLRILDNGKKLGIDIIKGEVENIDVKSDIPKVIKLLKNDLLVKKYS